MRDIQAPSERGNSGNNINSGAGKFASFGGVKAPSRSIIPSNQNSNQNKSGNVSQNKSGQDDNLNSKVDAYIKNNKINLAANNVNSGGGSGDGSGFGGGAQNTGRSGFNREYFQPKKSGNKLYLALGLIVSLVLVSTIFILATFVFDGATISIKPLKKETGLNETYIVSEADRKELLQTKEAGVSESITLPKKTVKKVFKKAEGELTIYNEFSKDIQKFIKGTKFETADGKIFKANDNVLIPGKIGNTPGQIKIKVTADVEGVEYNVGPTKFTVPGLKGSPKYKSFYAESSSTMKGGTSGSSADVSDVDLQKGLSEMKEKLIEQVQTKIGEDIPVNFNYNKDALVLTVSKFTKVSEDDSTATYEQYATGTTILFKKEEIVKRLLEKQGENDIAKPIVKVSDASRLVIGVSNQTEALKENSQVTLTITGPAPAIYYPNKQQILEYYAGRPVSDFNDITKKFQFIETAKRTIYPFWNSRFPTNISKIKVEFE